MKKKVLVRGPALTQSGYGEHTRFLLRSLRKYEDKIDIYLLAVNWGNTGWLYKDDEERRWIDGLLQKTFEYNQSKQPYDVSIQVTIPNEWEKVAPVNIGVTAGIETTKVSPQWIEKSAIMDKIITISEHAKNTYQNTTYSAKNQATGEITHNFRTTTPIEVVHYPVRKHETQKLDLDLEYDFNFLTVAQWGPRKNMKNTIRWFVEEFFDQEVGLVIKTNHAKNCTMDRFLVQSKLEQVLSKYDNSKRKCKIHLLHGIMSDEEISSLYVQPKIKAYYTMTHGEGFGLPIFEAAHNGLPVIAPDWSGHLDFLYMKTKEGKKKKTRTFNKAMFANVTYTINAIPKKAVWKGVLEHDSMWCYPDQGSCKMKLRDVYKNYDSYEKQAKKLQNHILKNFEQEKQYDAFVDAIFGDTLVSVEEFKSEVDTMFNEVSL